MMGRTADQLLISELQYGSIPDHPLLKLHLFCFSSGLEDDLL